MKNLKRLLLTLFAFSSAALCAGTLSACGEHEHNWGEWNVTTPATCTEAGLEEHVCKDDSEHTETRVVNATGHNWGEWEVTSPATCTEKAVETRVCANDNNHKETREVGEPLGHDWGEFTQTKAATCTEDGEKVRVCQNDSEHTDTRTVYSEGHDFGEWEVTTPATCTQKGEETRVCANDNNHKETREGAAPLDHNWGEWTVTTPATCTQKAVETRVCKNDKNHKETREAGEPLGHDWEVTDNTATCTEAGVKTLACSFEGCTATKTEESQPLGHSFGEWAVTTPATCTEKAVETHVCANDNDHKETRETGEPLGHDFGEWKVTTPSTCVTAGVETRVCGNDQKHTETRAAALAEHSWDGGTVTEQPTEYQPGVKTYACTVDGCGATKEEAIPELGHTHDFDVEFTTDADKHWKECAGEFCNETQSEGEHEWNGGEVTVPVTCTQNGETTYTCTVCGKTRTETVEASGHSYEYALVTPPDFDLDGTALKTCANCDFEEELKLASINAAGNLYKVKEHTAATCEEAGETTYEVTFEGGSLTFTVEVPAIEHKNLQEVAANAESKTFTSNGGRSLVFKNNKPYYTCPDCGKMFSDETCTYEITSALNLSRYGVPLGEGENKIAKTNGSGCVFFQAQSDGLFTFNFHNAIDDGGNSVDYVIANVYYIMSETNPPVIYTSTNSWYDTAAAYPKFENNTEALTDTVSVNMKRGECIIIVNTAADWFKVTVTSEIKQISYGENTVEVTSENATYYTSTDSYTFEPEETKTYMLKVPAGVTVIMDGNDLIVAGEEESSANFKGVAGVASVFTFISGTVGEFNVTVGEGMLPKITPDTPYDSFTVPDKDTAVLEVGDVEAGKYQLVITLNNTSMRSMVFFGKNINPDYNEIFGTNGFGGTAEVTFQNMRATLTQDVDYEVSFASLKITVVLDLEQGDKLVFAHSNTMACTFKVAITKV